MKKQAGTFKKGSTRPPSDLQVRYPGVKKVHPTRAQNLCAEQFAFDDLNRNNPNYNYHYVNTATVIKSANCVTTYMLKCENCEVFADKMGTDVTDCIPRETPALSSGYVRDGYIRCATSAVVTGIAAERCRKKKWCFEVTLSLLFLCLTLSNTFVVMIMSKVIIEVVFVQNGL